MEGTGVGVRVGAEVGEEPGVSVTVGKSGVEGSVGEAGLQVESSSATNKNEVRARVSRMVC
jgi:hypothetical protein